MARQSPLSCPGHTRPVVHLHYSGITDNGFYFITASKDGKPMLRQGDTGDWIGTFEGHKGAVWGACLNSGASRAATGAADFTAKVWDALSGQEIHSFTHKHIVKPVDFSPSNQLLLTGCNDKLLRVFDLSKPDVEPQMLEGHNSSLRCAVWISDTIVASCAEDCEVRIWDMRTSKMVTAVPTDNPVMSIEMSRDGELLTVVHGKLVTFMRTSSYEKTKTFTMPMSMYSASLHPSKSCFVAGGEDCKLYKFDFDDGKELESYKGHFGPVHCVRYSPDGEVYCSGSEDGTVRLWLNIVGKTYGLWRNPGDS